MSFAVITERVCIYCNQAGPAKFLHSSLYNPPVMCIMEQPFTAYRRRARCSVHTGLWSKAEMCKIFAQRAGAPSQKCIRLQGERCKINSTSPLSRLVSLSSLSSSLSLSYMRSVYLASCIPAISPSLSVIYISSVSPRLIAFFLIKCLLQIYLFHTILTKCGDPKISQVAIAELQIFMGQSRC